MVPIVGTNSLKEIYDLVVLLCDLINSYVIAAPVVVNNLYVAGFQTDIFQ